MLFDRQTFGDANELRKQLGEESVFRYSTFEGFSTEGGIVDGALLFCKFTRIDWYWGIFNLCVFHQCQFEDCTFRGTAFPGCRFVECSFVGCRFIKDNLAADCSFDDARWHACTQNRCEGLNRLVPIAS